MKYIAFEHQGKQGFGILMGDRVADLTAAGYGVSLKAWIESGAQMSHTGISPFLPLNEIKVTAPIQNPSKVVAIGLNYKDHAQEQNVPLPKAPLIFAKFPSSITGPYDPIIWDPALTGQVDYEVELGIVIGKRTRNVNEASALDYVFGFTVINDVSARDLQFGDKQWVRGKSLDTFCPTGPVVVTTDEITDPQNLHVRCLVNGTVMQDSNTAQMVFGVRELVAYCSRAFTLEPGDLIATGTPSGVGTFRKPPFYLKDGDVVRTEVEKIGFIENVCRFS